MCCLLLLQVRDHSQAILCLSPSPHPDRLLTASKDNQLRLWDFRQLGTVQVIRGQLAA
jgi:WD40 repeat protein